jgi:transcription elongation factor Elf1
MTKCEHCEHKDKEIEALKAEVHVYKDWYEEDKAKFAAMDKIKKELAKAEEELEEARAEHERYADEHPRHRHLNEAYD